MTNKYTFIDATKIITIVLNTVIWSTRLMLGIAVLYLDLFNLKLYTLLNLVGVGKHYEFSLQNIINF